MKSVSQQPLLSSQPQQTPNQNYNQLNSQYINGTGSAKTTHNANEDDIMNYQTLITKLAKGSIADKAIAIKKLLFLYQHSRARIYLYERRIVESLELCLLIEEKQVSLSGLTLLEKILGNASTESQIGSIFRKKLLSKVILNLGSVDINVRKISHKCIHEFIKKFKDYESVVFNYLKSALKPPQQQSTTKHLKLKAINSLHSLIMTESKSFRMDQEYALQLIEQLIASSYQKEFVEIRRASLICLICVLKISGSQNTLKLISMKTQNQLYQLRIESEELASLLEMIMKFHTLKTQQPNDSQEEQDEEYISSQNAPSPKFISIQQSQVLIQKPPKSIDQIEQKISTMNPTFQHQSMSQLEPQPYQMKIFNQVSYAEEFLKKLEKLSFSHFTSQSLQEIKSFAPFLQKYLVDQSIKLFSISKKIVEVIFDSMQQNISSEQKLTKRKQVYIVVVPCVVKGIGNKRFIVRKNLDKLVRTYAKNHPDVWINNFLDRFVKTQNVKIKEMLIDLFSYAYKTSPQFYYPVEKPFEIFDSEISNKVSTLRWKAIDCVILMIERQGKQTVIQQLLQKFSIDAYNKILRKLNKNVLVTTPGEQRSIQSNPGLIDIQIPSPVSGYKRKFRRNQRIVTDQGQKMLSIEKEEDNTDRNVSEERKINLNKGLFFKDKQNRKSFIDYDLKQRRKTEKKSRQSKQRTSIERLPELKIKTSANSQSLTKNELPQSTLPQSPVKKSFTQKNIMYTQKSQLQIFEDPKMQLEKALMTIKSSTSSWMSHFDSINKIRSVIENHPNVISEEHLQSIVTDMISCLNGNSRSGVMKISLICLDELLLKLKKRLYPYTETIMQAILKKSISTSEFMADQLKKCICICTQELCASKIISFVNSIIRQSKNTQIKLNILLIIQTMVKIDKVYKKEAQWVWMMLIELHDEPQFQLRLQCKNVVKLILELYKATWKQDVTGFKKSSLQKIDKILKNLNPKGENSWLEQEGLQFEKILFSKGINSKYFTTEYSKFQQTDKILLSKKNWKDRIKHINDTFAVAFDYSSQFQINLNAKKYMNILCEHLDEKNPGQLVNAVGLLIKCVQNFVNTQLVDEMIGFVLEKYIFVIETKRAELISTYQKLISKIYQKFDLSKIIKELIKLALSSSLKVKTQALNQLITIMKDEQSSRKQQKQAFSYGQKQRSKQKLKNKQNTIKQLIVQTPNTMTNNTKLSYNIGSQTPSAASSSINIQNSCLSINSQNKMPNSLTSTDNQKAKVTPSIISMIMKMINKITTDKLYQNSSIINNKIKDLVLLCNKKSGNQTIGKTANLTVSERNADFIE